MSKEKQEDQQADQVRLVPYPVTFFLSPTERTGVLRMLAKHSKDRRIALLKALRVEQSGGSS